MTDSVFTWAVAASLGTHLVGLAAASALGVGTGAIQASAVPIEVVRIEPEMAPAPPPPPPLRKLPRKVAPPTPAKPKREVVENRLALAPPTLLDEPREPQAPPTPTPPEGRFLTGNSLMPRGNVVVPGAREGGEAGAGRLFATGEIPVRPGRGLAAGSGAQGRGGTGLASRGSSQAEAGGPGGGTLTSLAHPLGGYQHMPAYPESARRQGVEGVTTLRFQVLTDGTVGEMSVARSAGHPDLDLAALEAVRKWRFEPARRGKDPVVVWVTLPVRFELRNQ